MMRMRMMSAKTSPPARHLCSSTNSLASYVNYLLVLQNTFRVAPALSHAYIVYRSLGLYEPK